ncbi:ABC transporter ATP-binding protein/permease, partial [Patescibacteria group bacterium]|nr:ABC transporter ATP-binding protein/permease [Patescibacteria group bacterium]
LVVVAAGDAQVPKMMERAVNRFVLGNDFEGLVRYSFLVFGVVMTVFIAQFFQTRIGGWLSERVLFDIRQKIFKKLQELPIRFYSVNQSGEIIQRITENVQDINRFFQHGFVRLTNVASSLTLVLIYMYLTDWRVATICLIGVGLVLAFLLIQRNILQRLNRVSLALDSGLTAFEKETLDGHKMIVSFNGESFWIDDFQKKNDHYLKFLKKLLLVSVTADGFLSFVSSLTTFAVLFFSLILFSQGELIEGTVMVLLMYTINTFKKTGNISRLWQSIQSGLVAGERLEQVLKLKTDILPSPNPYSPVEDQIKGEVEFQKVVFRYEQDKPPVLRGLNLKVKPGQSVAIVGATGAGKTTFVNLISRLYDVSEGAVLVDGVDVKGWDLDKLRGSIGYLIQDTFLFEDTIFNNLRYNNPEVTRKKAMEVFTQLGAEEFILSLSSGLDTIVDTQRNNMSAGQAQIVSLARVLLTEPKILILDEATAKIDTKSEKMIQKAIAASTEGVTSFV